MGKEPSSKLPLLDGKITRQDLFYAGAEKSHRDHCILPLTVNLVNDPGTKDVAGNPLAGS